MTLSTSHLVVAALVAISTAAPAAAFHHRAGKAGGAASRPRKVGCEACVVVDDRGRTLWARRPERELPNASTTKMMTALLVARRAHLDSAVRVSAEAARTGGGGLDLRAGERHSVLELLYALLLTSSNDAAVALAEEVAGSERAFVEAMNLRVGSLGAHRTHFVSAHGLDAPGHHSTAGDLARIAEAVLDDPLLARVVGTAAITLRTPAGPLVLENRNVLLEEYRGAIGVKTGYTDRAGEVLVAAARRHGRRVIAVAMRSRDATADCRRLLDFGFKRLRQSVLLPADALVGGVVFDPAGAIPAAAAETLRGLQDVRDVSISFTPRRGVRPPIERGEAVGTATLRAGRVVGSVPAVAAEPVDPAAPSRLLEALGALLRLGHRAARIPRTW